MDSHGCRLLLLLCCLCAHWTCGSAHPGLGQLHPPTNITFGMNGMFCLFWKWTLSDSTANCSLWYKTEILKSAKKPVISLPEGRNKHPYYTIFLDSRIDLNENVTLKVHTECDNRISDFKTFTSPLATGNPRTMVRSMTCIWHYKEYVNCSWQPREDVQPSVDYRLRYWLTEDLSCPEVENEQPTPFHHLLNEGEPCEKYTYRSGIPVGCQFKLEKDFNKFIHLVVVVTDRSQNIKPYIYFTCVNSIAKLKAPVINVMNRTQNKSVFVSWNVSDTSMSPEYEVKLDMSNSKSKDPYQVLTDQSKEFPNALPDVTYTVKVRMKLPQNALCFRDPFLWSEWSDERTLKTTEGKKTASIVLLVLVSLVIIVATVLLLINMRRLLILIFPHIPDPSKVISSDFQQWLKYGKSVYNEPINEEVCVVSLLETPPSSSQVE